MLLSIIIVSYNTKNLTIQALKSVFFQLQTSPKLAKQTEIIVVDNHSTDGSTTAISQLSHTTKIKTTLIKNKENVGFARANNQAIKKSKGNFVFLLNSDTKLQKNCLKYLINTFAQYQDNEVTASLSSTQKKIDKLAIVAASLLNPDGTNQPQGGSYPTLLTVFSQMFFLDDIPFFGKFFPSTQHTGLSQRRAKKSNQLIKQAWVGATAMMIKKSVLNKIGLLDKNIFMYAEDMELCLRAQNHHYDIVINPKAKVIHYGSASSSQKNAVVGEIKGLIYLWGKHKPNWQMSILKTILQLGCLLRIILFSLIGQQKKVKIYQECLKQIK